MVGQRGSRVIVVFGKGFSIMGYTIIVIEHKKWGFVVKLE